MINEPCIKEEVLSKEITLDRYSLTLFNDDVNTFDHVIDLLVKVCGHTHIQAEQCATLVHFSGKCVVKSAEYNKLRLMADKLMDNGLTVEIN